MFLLLLLGLVWEPAPDSGEKNAASFSTGESPTGEVSLESICVGRRIWRVYLQLSLSLPVFSFLKMESKKERESLT